MRTVIRFFSMLAVAVAPTPAYAEESPRQLTLADCEAMLAPVIARHLPQAKITVDDSERLAYGGEPAPARPFLEVAKGEAGGFQVKIEGHTIPAVIIDNTVVFTTGDVVYSDLPSFSGKPYCTLEMFLLIRTEGKFFFGSPLSPPDKWMPLTKHNQP